MVDKIVPEMDREVEESGEDQGGIGEMCTTISAEKV
jgi:hypothetical protein